MSMVQDVVLFEGIDASNRTGLWVTNGTAAGTFELTTSGQPPAPGTPPITGEAPCGFLPSPAVSLDLTVFNNQVLFVGRYGQTNYGLWTTDGMGVGTVQLANISGANAAGIFTQAISPDFTVYNGEVLFNGRDNAATPLQSLWTTNGTAAGTHEVTGINGAASTGSQPDRHDRLQWQCSVQRRGHGGPSRPLGDQRHGCGNPGADVARRLRRPASIRPT